MKEVKVASYKEVGFNYSVCEEIFENGGYKQFIDTKAIVPGKHGLATMLYSGLFTAVLALLVQGTKNLLSALYTAARRVVMAGKGGLVPL